MAPLLNVCKIQLLVIELLTWVLGRALNWMILNDYVNKTY